MHRPVVVAVIVNIAVTIEEKSILALLKGQCAIGTEEEAGAVVGVRICMDSVGVGTCGGTENCDCGSWKGI